MCRQIQLGKTNRKEHSMSRRTKTARRYGTLIDLDGRIDDTAFPLLAKLLRTSGYVEKPPRLRKPDRRRCLA